MRGMDVRYTESGDRDEGRRGNGNQMYGGFNG